MEAVSSVRAVQESAAEGTRRFAVKQAIGRMLSLVADGLDGK